MLISLPVAIIVAKYVTLSFKHLIFTSLIKAITLLPAPSSVVFILSVNLYTLFYKVTFVPLLAHTLSADTANCLPSYTVIIDIYNEKAVIVEF